MDTLYGERRDIDNVAWIKQGKNNLSIYLYVYFHCAGDIIKSFLAMKFTGMRYLGQT